MNTNENPLLAWMKSETTEVILALRMKIADGGFESFDQS